MRIPSSPPIPLIFTRDLTTALSVQYRPLVAVTKPSKPTDWNNFGYRFQNDCYLLKTNGAVVPIETTLMFAGGRDTSTVISELVAGGGWIEATSVPFTFCSLMHSEEDYRTLVTNVGLETAATVLRRLGDAVVLNLEGGDPNQIALIESDAFFLSMLRQDRSWTALRRGARHFRYLPLVETSDAATSFSMVVDLPSADNRYRVGFDFTKDRLIRDRFAVLIGRNGAGKSQLLLSIIDGLANSNIRLVPRRRKVRFKHDDEGKHKFGPPIFSRIVAFSSTPSDTYPTQIDP
ncbi:hypothetical protein [Rhizobium mongolense]